MFGSYFFLRLFRIFCRCFFFFRFVLKCLELRYTIQSLFFSNRFTISKIKSFQIYTKKIKFIVICIYEQSPLLTEYYSIVMRNFCCFSSVAHNTSFFIYIQRKHESKTTNTECNIKKKKK